MENFEKRYNGLEIEKKMQKYWEDNKVYEFIPDKSKPIYSIDTPPPTVNGSLHIGHIFSYTQAEMIARYRRMNGYNVFYPFGFDDNGLPSERLVEKETGLKAKDLPRKEFCEKCVNTVNKYEDEFKRLWKSLGFSCDWNLEYTTISPTSQKLSQKSFLDLAKAGHAYTKESPVLWCTECQTAIAQSELETKDIDSTFNYLKFRCGDQIVIVATTRPELLYGVVCVFVNPDDERYSNLIGKEITVPLYDFNVPVYGDAKVGIDKGTGVVMCATYGDTTDVEWATEYNLPYKKTILPNGVIAEDVPYIGGLYSKKARKVIIDLLIDNDLLVKSESITHQVATHERCGTEIEIIPSKQWYIDVLSKKEEIRNAGDKINWYPAHMKNRFSIWVDNLKWDWCISRQRYFGVPFPVWYCADCGKAHFPDEKELPVNPIDDEFNGVCVCGCTKFAPETAVLDTWATSSISTYINKETSKKYGISDEFMPMSMRTQAHEIIRTWAFYSIVKSLYHDNIVPWKDAMICGFVLAKPGEKISKSKSNAKLSPQKIIDTYSADAIRYWAANPKLGTDTYFDQQEMQEASKKITNKLWNSSKFVFSHLYDFNPNEKIDKILPVDQWIIEKVKKTVQEVRSYLDQYEVGLAKKVIDDLFWKDFCDYYIEIVKERLYQPDKHGHNERKSGQYASYYALLNILKLYSIYIPHVTEYIYLKGFKEFEKSVSIHLTQWEKVESIDENIISFGEELKMLIFSMRKYKSENAMSMKDEIENLTITILNNHKKMFELTEKDIIACSHAKKLTYDFKKNEN